MVLYRGPRTEMKHLTTTTVYTATTANAFVINNPVQGPAQNERIGNKIKVHFIEAVIACTASTPIRLDLVLPNDSNVAFTATYDGALDRRSVNPLLTRFLHNGTTTAAAGTLISHRLPFGIVTKHLDGTNATPNKNAIIVCLSTPVAQTITGYFRTWYTDA